MHGDLIEIAFVENDDGLWEVANEAAHLDVLALSDDDGLVAIAYECGECVMRLSNERAGGVDDVVAGSLPSSAILIGSAVGGDGDLNGGGAVQVVEIAFSGTDGGQMAIDDGIVDELAENGQRGALRGGVGGTQGVADAEAHAVMLGEVDVHDVVRGLALWDKVSGQKETRSALLGGLDDLSEDFDVALEGLASFGGEFVAGARACAGFVAGFFDVTGCA